MIEYAKELARFRRSRTIFLFVLLICGALSEGIGLLSLVPMVELIGVANAGDGAGGSRLASWLAGLAVQFGWSPTLRDIILVFLAAILARALIVFAVSEISAGLSNAYLHDLRSRLFAAIAAARWQDLTRQSQPRLHQALSSAPYQLAHGLAVCVRILSAATLMAIGCLLALLAEPLISGLVLICALILALPMLVFSRMSYRAAQADYEKIGALYGRIGAHLGNLKMNRFLGGDGPASPQSFDRASRQDAALLQRIARINASASLTNQIGAAVLLAVAIGLVTRPAGLFGAGQPTGLQSTHAILLIVIFARLLPQAQALFANIRQLAEISAPYHVHRSLVGTLKAAAEPAGPPAEPRDQPPEIMLDGVSFSYDGQTKVLADVTMHLPAGKTCAVVGPSGAGKTTLTDLICGLLPPTAGSILVDGEPLVETGFAAWRSEIGLVTQDESLFAGSLRDNLAPGEKYDDHAIWQALDRVGIAERVLAAPLQLDMMLGERGDGLSRGECQRVCLARALIRKPKVLVLDEATSALNPIDEASIIKALLALEGSMTVLIIAHRLSSVSHADQVFVLDRGRLIDNGRFEELIGRTDSFIGRMVDAGLPGRGISADADADTSETLRPH